MINAVYCKHPDNNVKPCQESHIVSYSLKLEMFLPKLSKKKYIILKFKHQTEVSGDNTITFFTCQQ
jgi:hypothetical protein